MIKINKNDTFFFKETIKKIGNKKELLIYSKLLALQQEKIYFQTIKEMTEYLQYSYKTLQKYINILIEYHLIEKYKGIYIINLIPQKRAE